jgi:cytochrome c553
VVTPAHPARAPRSSGVTHRAAVAVLAVTLAALASCGPPAREARRVAAPASGPTAAWDELPPAARLAAMRASVTQRMRALFVAEDPHRYARFACATCHGRDGPARGYRMPNPDLLLEPTPWNTGPSPDPAQAPSARDAFMARVVAPEMGRLLGRRDAASGCFACHTREE